MERNNLKSKLRYLCMMLLAMLVTLSIQSKIVYAETNVVEDR